MKERLPRPTTSGEAPLKRKGSGILERIALIAGLALAPKSTASAEMPRSETTQTNPSEAHHIEALRRQITRVTPGSTMEMPAPPAETARPTSEQIGREGVSALLSDGDLQAFLATPGDAVDFSAQAMDDVLAYRDSHLERLPTLSERRASRRQANKGIAQEVQRRIDLILSGGCGGTPQQQQDLAVALSTAFSIMFDDGHRILHTYSFDNGVFIDSEPARVTITPGADIDAVDAEPGVDDPETSPEERRADPATDDPEDYEEDEESA